MPNSALKIAPREDVMELMHARNVKAMELVYDEYSCLLFGIIQRVVNDRQKAEQVLFKTLTYIWNHYHQYDSSQQSVCLWMINIARQFSLEALSFNEQRNIETHLMDTLKQEGLKEEMTVLELVFFRGVPVNKIAEKAGCSTADVRTLLHGAVCKLKKNNKV
jgi:DNA-directed RNA polymerase specialized sigma24 family protein